ncbi:MAG: hypothetical protein IJS22_06295 [Lachnospiraceae bacterium]|nr:hypothetical protein [Lachnospiraceae bacterium]
MKKEYTVGPRFSKIKYLSVAVNSAIVFMFYFIYRYVFGARLGSFAGWPMVLVFLGLGFVIAFATVRIADRYAAGIGYTVTGEGLVCRTGRKEELLRWEDFSSAVLRELRFTGVHPVEFEVAGRKIMLNQYINDLCGLTQKVFDHIEDHVAIDPALKKRTEDLKGVY